MKNWILTILLVAASAFAGTGKVFDQNGSYELNRMSRLFDNKQVGTQLFNATQWGAKSQMNTLNGHFGAVGYNGSWVNSTMQGNGSNIALQHDTDYVLLDSENLPIIIPGNSYVWNCLIEVASQPYCADSSCSISFWINTKSTDLDAANYQGHHTLGLHACSGPQGTTATAVHVASDSPIMVHLGSEAITGGKVNVWLQYILADH